MDVRVLSAIPYDSYKGGPLGHFLGGSQVVNSYVGKHSQQK